MVSESDFPFLDSRFRGVWYQCCAPRARAVAAPAQNQPRTHRMKGGGPKWILLSVPEWQPRMSALSAAAARLDPVFSCQKVVSEDTSLKGREGGKILGSKIVSLTSSRHICSLCSNGLNFCVFKNAIMGYK